MKFIGHLSVIAQHMKAILLSAGLGTRLTPLTNVLPKGLMPINGRPLLEHWLSTLARAGIGPFLINIHHHSDMIRSYVKNSSFSDRVSLVFEEELLGTGGTLIANRDFVGNEPVMLIHGDNICFADMEAFARAHGARPKNTFITMMTFTTPTPKSCGIVGLDDKGVVRTFQEKPDCPASDLANGAVYILEPDVLDFCIEKGRSRLDFSTEVLPEYTGRMTTYHNTVYHRDIGTPESLLRAQLECPQPGRPPQGPDSWHDIACSTMDGFYDSFAQTLSNDIRLIKANQTRRFDLSEKFNPPAKGDPSFNSVVFFPKARPGFSSKEFYKKYNMASFAFCTCED